MGRGCLEAGGGVVGNIRRRHEERTSLTLHAFLYDGKNEGDVTACVINIIMLACCYTSR